MKKETTICDNCGDEMEPYPHFTMKKVGKVRVKVYGTVEGVDTELDLCGNCIEYQIKKLGEEES